MAHKKGENITYIKCIDHPEQDMNEIVAVDPDNPNNKVFRCPHADHDADFEMEE